MAADNFRKISPFDQLVVDENGRVIGLQIRNAKTPITNFATLSPDGSGSYTMQDPDGGVISLSEISPVVTITATGSVATAAGYYRGIKVTAYSGGPQTITIYDALSATGTPVDTIVVSGTGTWLWDRPSDSLGGVGGRRPMATGCWAVISGGTSRTIDVMFE